MNIGKIATTPKWEIRLRSIYGKLSLTEQKVADFIRSHSDTILDLSIADIAASAGVSESSVIRFCHHLGIKGLKEFKIIYAQEMDCHKLFADSSSVIWDDSLSTVKMKVFYGSIYALNDSLTLLNDHDLELAVDALFGASNIDIYGLGGSAPIAAYTRHQLMKIGVRTNIYTDAQSISLSLSQFMKGDVAIAISSSGETKEIVDAMYWAHKQESTIIGITNFPNSQLGKIADIKLITTGGRFFLSDMNSFSRVAQWAIINTLYLGLTLRIGKQTLEKNQEQTKTGFI
jgi:DNA-binding MurR/RpiR family transcriptional regulator